MRLYSVHFHPRDSWRSERPPVLVKEGFSWPCLILGWIGLLFPRSWLAALLAGAVSLAMMALLRPVSGSWPIFAELHLLLGLFGNDLRRWELRLRDFSTGPLVAGRNADAALIRLLDLRPELLGGGA